MFVNAGTWGLMLTGKLVTLADETQRNVTGALKRLIGRAGEPVIRLAVRQAMRIMGHQFVMGRTIKEALERAVERDNRAYRYSYDMLGEAALTQPDAERYHRAYKDAIVALGKNWGQNQQNPQCDPDAASGRLIGSDPILAPSISIKLSALHPRYEVAKRARVHAELTPKLLELAQLAKQNGIGLTVDAEEADRLELSLDVIAAVHADPSLAGWNGYGLAVQAYQKRAPFVIDWLAERAKKVGQRFCVRLVKGAYWDSEIKRAQEGGHAGYPVFTRKPNTDVSYLACARAAVRSRRRVLPRVRHAQRAHDRRDPSHRAWAAVRIPAPARHGCRSLRRSDRREEPQRAVPRLRAGRQHEDLLPYLVRRLLENGANTEFRQPHRRRVAADQGSRRRPVRHRARVREQAAPAHPATDRPLTANNGRIPWA